MVQKCINIETAKKLLMNACDFLKVDESGIADFIIPDKEVFLMLIYTGAEHCLSGNYRVKFNYSFLSGREPFLIKKESKYGYEHYLGISPYFENIPLFSKNLSSYLQLFHSTKGEKFLFLLDSWEDITKKITDCKINPFDCIIWLTYPYSFGRVTCDCYGEDFWECLSAIVLRQEGYFISTFSLHGGDIYAYMIPDYLKKLENRGFLKQGAFVEELEMLRSVTEATSSIHLEANSEEIICIEAEPTDKRGAEYKGSGIFQLRDYLKEGKKFYTSGIVAAPFVDPDIPRSGFGLISCDEQGGLIFQPPSKRKEPNKNSVSIVKKYIKNILLRNLTYNEICGLIKTKTKNLNEYFEAISKLNIEVILDRIEEKVDSK